MFMNFEDPELRVRARKHDLAERAEHRELRRRIRQAQQGRGRHGNDHVHRKVVEELAIDVPDRPTPPD